MLEKLTNWVKQQDTATLVLVSLLAADVFLILVFLSYRLLGWPPSYRFNIGIDQSIPEYFQYMKQLATAGLMLLVFLRGKQVTVLLWSAIAVLLFLDDALKMHEKLGGVVSSAFAIPDAHGFRGQDFGELIVASTLAGLILISLAVRYWRDNSRLRTFSVNMLLFLALLGMFGVVIDLFVHKLQSLTLYIIEDGGEMIAMSLMLFYAWRYRTTGQTKLRPFP